MEPVKIGIIGTGNISDWYLRGASRSRLIKVKAVADIRPEAAKAKAEAFGTTAVTVDELLADPEIEIVMNLTLPMVHAAVSRQILEAGKHVYVEKPITATFAAATRRCPRSPISNSRSCRAARTRSSGASAWTGSTSGGRTMSQR